MAQCHSCGAEVIWAEQQSGSKGPFDATPDPKGLWFLMNRLRQDPLAIPQSSDVPFAVSARNTNEHRYTSHFATCPNAKKHRKGK